MKINTLLCSAGLAAMALVPATNAQTPTSQPAYNNAAAAPAPSQVVYAPRLPSATDLTNAASAQGMTVERITESGSQVIAVYRLSNGQMTTVSYQLLPTAGSSAPNQATQGVALPTTPAPAVAGLYAPAQSSTTVYTTAPSDAYYYYPDAYGWGWYPPFYGVGLGLGFYHSYYHGFGVFRGGFHGGFRGGFHGGGFHR